MKNPAEPFADNRAEEAGYDLWKTFVIPPYFSALALDTVRRPLVIEGGRGCGKTSLLRYLSHRTQFSLDRELSADRLPKQVGLYLRADTQFLRTFRGEWLSEEEWHKVFSHALCLMLLSELLDALNMLRANEARRASFPGISNLQFDVLSAFDPTFPAEHSLLQKDVDRRRVSLEIWMNNPETGQRPLLLPMKSLLLAIIQSVRSQVPALSNVDIFVFIDEYENLLEYQMRVINTWLKHSEPPLIFHIAAKRNSMTVRNTVGTEQLQERDDFRRIDIEELLGPLFEVFAAELFFSRLARKVTHGIEIPIDLTQLSDPNSTQARFSNSTYRATLLSAMEQVFPSMSHPQIAEYIFRDETLYGRLSKAVTEALDSIEPTFDAHRLLREDAPMGSICTLPLLYQGKKPSDLARELESLSRGESSKFKSADWQKTYFLGAVLYLYLPLQRPCIVYSGFNSFIKMARGNVRHFIELCYISLREGGDNALEHGVSAEAQARAARAASVSFLKETKGAGDHGPKLHQVASTLGQIFRLSQQRPAQSEAERSHFSITPGTISQGTELLLRECEKWSVLYAEPETKVKDSRFQGTEYILNPIFAPCFGISFNKGRRLELGVEEAEHIFGADGRNVDEIVKTFSRLWKIDSGLQRSLFDP